ncbi:MAG: sigma-70 family RNA polymerase sigma factor [Saprospiraceae bacterium]|nr:sigma-70 family RNA polymerase sigma factor [Saprospiraceae bacterium]
MVYHLQSTDDELRAGCIQQHRLAQQYLYQRYFGQLLGTAWRYTQDREEAVEVTNAAFLKIFNSLEKYQDTGSFGGWMAKIVIHTAIDHVRHQAVYRRNMNATVEADLPVHNDSLSRLETEDLLRLIQQLPPASRSVFSLYVIDGYKHREIADLLGIDEGTSKWHLSTARKELQQLVKKYYQTSL